MNITDQVLTQQAQDLALAQQNLQQAQDVLTTVQTLLEKENLTFERTRNWFGWKRTKYYTIRFQPKKDRLLIHFRNDTYALYVELSPQTVIDGQWTATGKVQLYQDWSLMCETSELLHRGTTDAEVLVKEILKNALPRHKIAEPTSTVVSL